MFFSFEVLDVGRRETVCCLWRLFASICTWKGLSTMFGQWKAQNQQETSSTPIWIRWSVSQYQRSYTIATSKTIYAFGMYNIALCPPPPHKQKLGGSGWWAKGCPLARRVGVGWSRQDFEKSPQNRCLRVKIPQNQVPPCAKRCAGQSRTVQNPVEHTV